MPSMTKTPKRTVNRVARVLAEVERNLQVIIGETAMAGEYALSRDLSGVAESVRHIHAQLKTPDPPVRSVESASHYGKSLPSSNSTKGKEASREPKSARAANRASKQPQKDGSVYPRFEIRRGTLVRIGWSKKNKAPYEHKIAESAFSQAVQVMASVAEDNDGPLTADQFIDAAASLNDPIASYQVYVVLGFLTAASILTKEGREGYYVPDDLPQRARTHWLAAADLASAAT